MEPSCFTSSVVKRMEGSTELMCCRNSSFCDFCKMTKVSSTYLLHNLGRFTADVIDHSSEFADDFKKIKLEKVECIISYDVSTLFTSIPVQSAIQVTKKKLEQSTELHQRTTMSISDILKLLEFCLYNTYFLFQGQFYD